jgi:putative thioredoxin
LASSGLTAEQQKEVDAFRDAVATPSMDKLVILDFWAEWCGPCKQLTPVLEKVAAEYADKGVILAKVNVDEQKFIASQFQVRSIPTVYAMYQGQPVADLTNARTEPQLAAMLDQLLEKFSIVTGGTDLAALPEMNIDAVLTEGELALGHGDDEVAYGLFTEVLGENPDNVTALSGMLRALAALGRHEEGQAIYDSLSEEQRNASVIERAKAALVIAAAQLDPAEIAALKTAVEVNPNDHQARFDLANAIMAAGDRDGAAETLLAIIAANKEWEDGKAKTRLLEIFSMIGLEDEWVAATRRKLSAVLFG